MEVLIEKIENQKGKNSKLFTFQFARQTEQNINEIICISLEFEFTCQTSDAEQTTISQYFIRFARMLSDEMKTILIYRDFIQSSILGNDEKLMIFFRDPDFRYSKYANCS